MLMRSVIRVFVVDDEPIIASSLAKIFQNSGYRAAAYVRPEEALEDAKANPPDLVISDVVMPVMSGIELAEEIKSQVPGCKILLFSAQAQTDDLFRKAHLLPGEFRLLAKPVHPAVILEEVAHLLAPPQPAPWVLDEALTTQ